MAIPTFNNGQGGQSIRVDSLNEAITEVNRLTNEVDNELPSDINAVSSALDGLADQQRREEFFQTVLKPAGIDIPPVHLFWPSSQNDRTQDATIARPGSAWVFNEFGQLVERDADEVLRDYEPATGAFLGALAEPQRENVNPYSWRVAEWEEFTNVIASTEDGFSVLTEEQTASDSYHAATVSTASLYVDETVEAVRSWVLEDLGARFITVGSRPSSFLENEVAVIDLQEGVVVSKSDPEGVLNGLQVRKLSGRRVYIEAWSEPQISGSRRRIGVGFASPDGQSVEYTAAGGRQFAVWHTQVEVTDSRFATSPIITDGSSVIRPATTMTLPQVGDRRRGFVAWQGFLRFDPDAGSSPNRVRNFPFGRTVAQQGLELLGTERILARSPTGSDFVILEPPLDGGTLQSRRGRMVYWWDVDAGVFGLSVDGNSAESIDPVSVPPDAPIRFGQTDTEREGASHTDWIYISYNYPTIEQIEAFTAGVLPE